MMLENIPRLYADLKVPVLPVINFNHFIACKRKRPARRIGVLKKDVPGLNSHRAGSFILFTPYTPEDCYGKMTWDEMERHVQLCTIETPSPHFFEGTSKLDTNWAMVGVPLSYIAFEIQV